MNCDPLRRVGEFEVPWALLERAPERVLKILEGCVVVRAEARADRCSIVYAGLHPEFAEVPKGAFAPRYDYEFDAEGQRRWRRRHGSPGVYNP